MGWSLKEPWFGSRQGQVALRFCKGSRSVFGPNQPPIEWVLK